MTLTMGMKMVTWKALEMIKSTYYYEYYLAGNHKVLEITLKLQVLVCKLKPTNNFVYFH